MENKYTVKLVPLTFEQATTYYRKRANAFVGRKLYGYVNIIWDEALNAFKFIAIKSKYECNKYESGEYVWNVGSTPKKLPISEWKADVIGHLYKNNRIVLTDINNFSAAALRKYFRLKVSKPKNKAKSGRMWQLVKPDTPKYGDITYSAPVFGNGPVCIHKGRITLSAPGQTRKVNKYKGDILNKKIAKIRKILKVRIKVGALKTAGVLSKVTFEKFVHSLEHVDHTDIGTLHDLIDACHGVINSNWTWAWHFRKKKTSSPLEVFERAIALKKESLRKHYHAVTYE